MAPSAELSTAMEEVRSYALGTQVHARTLLDGQRVGIPSGRLDPWTADYMHLAVDICLETVPASFLIRLAHSVTVSAATMQDHRLDGAPVASWGLLQQHAEAVVEVVGLRFPEFADEPFDTLDRPDDQLGILRWDKLAAIATRGGSASLATAATNVITYCLRRLRDVTDDEVEWLLALHRGERTADVAAAHGFSERHFYRALNRLWAKLGVANRAEGIAKASRNGWLD